LSETTPNKLIKNEKTSESISNAVANNVFFNNVSIPKNPVINKTVTNPLQMAYQKKDKFDYPFILKQFLNQIYQYKCPKCKTEIQYGEEKCPKCRREPKWSYSLQDFMVKLKIIQEKEPIYCPNCYNKIKIENTECVACGLNLWRLFNSSPTF
jgi:hypothetical protein